MGACITWPRTRQDLIFGGCMAAIAGACTAGLVAILTALPY